MRAVCPRCHRKALLHHGRAEDGRPCFKCAVCDYVCTAGLDGGEYAHLVTPNDTEAK